MKLNCGAINRSSTDLFVSVTELFEVAIGDHGVAHPPRREVHERIANVADFHVDDGREVLAVVMELSGVPHDH